MSAVTKTARPLERQTRGQVPSSMAAAVILRDRKCPCGATKALRILRNGKGGYITRCATCKPFDKTIGNTTARPVSSTRTSKPMRSRLIARRKAALENLNAYRRALLKGDKPARGAVADALLKAQKQYDDSDRALAVANVKANLASDTDRQQQPRRIKVAPY